MGATHGGSAALVSEARQAMKRVWFIEEFIYGEWWPKAWERTRDLASVRRRKMDVDDKAHGLIPVNGFRRRVVGYRRER